MKLTWRQRIKIRLRHARVSEPERRALRVRFEEIMTTGWPEAPLKKKVSEKDVSDLRRARHPSMRGINLDREQLD